MVSPLRAERLSVAKFLQLDCGAELAWSLSRPAVCSVSGSSLLTPSIETGADEAPAREMAPGVCASSLVCPWWLPEPPGWTWVMDRTTSPLQIGQVRRRVVNHGVLKNGLAKKYFKDEIWQCITYMHSTWNSWPHGRLITRLSPSMYSSRQTTHSTCLPVYFRLHRVDPACRLYFSSLGRFGEVSIVPETVCERDLVSRASVG